MDLYNIPFHIVTKLQSIIEDCLTNKRWNVPTSMHSWFPFLLSHINKIVIPMVPYNDRRVWNHTTSGHLSLQDAYCFTSHHHHQVAWHKLSWNHDIPHSHSTLSWRIFHTNMPIGDNFMIKGCSFLSMCTLCM